MNTWLIKIAIIARRISKHGRAELAADVQADMDNQPLSDIDQAWIQMAEKRLDDLNSGRIEAIPASRLFNRIRKEYGWNREY